ncbi:MAG: HD domain-containing protein [Campylobacterota bacterium]|nr:HD domain-containing protein [Campylobacterota bacterium]
MKFIETLKRNIIPILGFVFMLFMVISVVRSTNLLKTEINHLMKKEALTQAQAVKVSLTQFLERNKKITNDIFLNIPKNNSKIVLKTYINKYIHLSDKDYIETVYFIDERKGILFLYPAFSERFLPLEFVENSESLVEKIRNVRKAQQALYFQEQLMGEKLTSYNAACLIKPLFFYDGSYAGSVVEIVDLRKRLVDISSYLEDYEINLIDKRGEVDKLFLSVFVPLYVDECCFGIELINETGLDKELIQNLSKIIFSLVLVTLIAFLIVIGVIFTESIRRKRTFERSQKRLNQRIKVLEDILTYFGREISDNSIRNLLFGLNEAFTSQISSIFLEKQSKFYMFDEKIKRKNFLRTEGTLAYYVWKKKKDIMTNNFQEEKFISDEIKKTTGVHAAICVVVAFGENFYGAICTGYKDKRRKFSEEDLRFLKLVAHKIATNIYYSAISNEIIETLVNSIEARDKYTRAHSRRVAEYARYIAKVIGFDNDFQRDIFTAGLFHDVGKIGIPDIVLLKPGKLSPNEYGIMKLHPVFSYEILKDMDTLKPVLGGIRAHHERWDGTGYPDGLKGKEIPIGGRILAMADAFDAITTDRPYRKAMTLSEAEKELTRNAGIQFDPEIVKKILPHLKHIYELGKSVNVEKSGFFPEYVDKARQNMFYTDWFTGLLTVASLQNVIDNLINKNINFTIYRIDVVNFSYANYKMGREKANSFLSEIANLLRENIGEDVARSGTDSFAFIVKDMEEPENFARNILDLIKEKVGLSVRYAYVVYPEDGENIKDLMYKLDVRYKQKKASEAEK